MRKSPFRFLPFVLVLAFQAAASASAPNFILILSDDQGWTHTAARMDKNNPDSRSDFFQTPHLEKMAAAGMRFSRGYAPA